MQQSRQQHDPLEVVHYLDQEIGPSDNASDPNVKPFSLRQYVHAVREKDISLNWPFPERYLKICLKHGISNVLPPLEPHDSTNDQPLRNNVDLSSSEEEKPNDVSIQDNMKSISTGLEYPQEEKGNVVSTGNNTKSISEDKIKKASCDLYFDEPIAEVSMKVCQSLSCNSFKYGGDNQLSPDTVLEPLVLVSSATAPSVHPIDGQSAKALTSLKRMRHKRRKRRGKLKKRSMVEICAVAKHRTLEDLENSYRLSCDSVECQVIFGEGSEQMTHASHGCKTELSEECIEKKYESNQGAAADENLSSRKGQELKFKFSRCKSRSCNKKLKLSQAVDVKDSNNELVCEQDQVHSVGCKVLTHSVSSESRKPSSQIAKELVLPT